jgi:hypothetical protein
VQLYDLQSDPGEMRNRQADHPEIVRELISLLEDAVSRGRSTPGPIQKNDVERIQYLPQNEPPALSK